MTLVYELYTSIDFSLAVKKPPRTVAVYFSLIRVTLLKNLPEVVFVL